MVEKRWHHTGDFESTTKSASNRPILLAKTVIVKSVVCVLSGVWHFAVCPLADGFRSSPIPRRGRRIRMGRSTSCISHSGI
jgi:hypothetical protein